MRFISAAILTSATLVGVSLHAYEKKFIPVGATEETVRNILGEPSKVEKIYSTNPDLNNVCIGEKWIYSYKPAGLNLTWVEMGKNWVTSNTPPFFAQSDLKYPEETLRVQKGVLERFARNEIQIQGVSLNLEYTEGYLGHPVFRLKFSHINKRKEPIEGVTFYVELVDDEESPVASNSRQVVARMCMPDMQNSVVSTVPVDFPKSGVIKMPRFLRFSAYDSAGKKLSLADGLYEIVEPK